MNSSLKQDKYKSFRYFIPFGILMVILTLTSTGCTSKYGQLKHNAEVQQAFELNQVPRDYKYFHYSDSEPYVILGLIPSYSMESTMWREAYSDTEEFKEMVRWIWEDYGYYKFGADILDPKGTKVGIMYTAIRETSVKFVGDNQIVVMPHTPFLWGPEAGRGGGVRAR
jgi:hypothetical protein